MHGRQAVALAALLASAAPTSGWAQAVTGTATFRERLALPPGAALEVTLEDVSRADVASDVLGRAVVRPAAQVPIRFSIVFDPSRVDPRHRYAVRARITREGRLLFTSARSRPVLTQGGGTEVDVVLERVGASRESPPPLAGTRWKLSQLDGSEVAAANPGRDPFLELDQATGRASGSGGCNRFSGSFRLDGRHLRFGRGFAATEMICADGMELERSFLDALGRVKAWKARGNELELLDASGKVVARFLAAASP